MCLTLTPSGATIIKGKKANEKWKITSVDKGVEKLELPYVASGNVKWCSCCGKQFGHFSTRYT